MSASIYEEGSLTHILVNLNHGLMRQGLPFHPTYCVYHVKTHEEAEGHFRSTCLENGWWATGNSKEEAVFELTKRFKNQ